MSSSFPPENHSGTRSRTTTPNRTSEELDEDQHENHDEEEQVVRALAAKLAPDIQELDTLLSSPVPDVATRRRLQYNDGDDDESSTHTNSDDEMDWEWKRLAASEQLLRQELEMADNVSMALLGSPTAPGMVTAAVDSKSALWLVEKDMPQQQQQQQIQQQQQQIQSTLFTTASTATDVTATPDATGTTTTSTTAPLTSSQPPTTPSSSRRNNDTRSFYTLADHAHTIGLQTEVKGGWYYVHDTAASTSRTVLDDVKEYVLPLQTEDLQRLYVGLLDDGRSSTGSSGRPPSNDDEQQGERVLTAAPEQATTRQSASSDTVPIATMEATNVSIPETASSFPSAPSPHASSSSSPLTLPVRTVVFRIRPDVLCGAVMDAMAHALMTLGAELVQRQGGRLRGIVGECCVVAKNNNTTTMKDGAGSTTTLPAYMVDAQLCTYRGNTATSDSLCQRSLLLRVYHIGDGDVTIGVPASTPCLNTEWMQEQQHGVERLREAAAWVQQMEASLLQTQTTSSSSWFAQSPKIPPLRKLRGQSSRESIQESVSQHLLSHSKACPSVLDGGGTLITLPILSTKDAPLIQASSRWIHECWHELDTRDLCHSTLQMTNFGAFPALPTLDVHFCQQLRRVCRDTMIRSLLKSAAELEQYARESEYACASLIQTMRPTFDMYHVTPPALPQPLPLTAYPLDFVPPQVTCPPWGMKVMEALNRVAAMTNEANKVLVQTDDAHVVECLSSFQLEQECVELVVFAFQRQDDDEMSCRLGRKNIQVMDRLAKMQAHKRDSIGKIRDSYDKSPFAAHAAEEFYAKALQADPEFGLLSPAQQIPLFKCSVLVGSATGTCYVTASHILFSTKRLPVLGQNTCTVLELTDDLEFVVSDSSSSLLNPLPTRISIMRNEEEVFSFRPSYGASR